MPLTAIALAAALQAAVLPSSAAPQSDNERMHACLALVRSNPQQAATEAQAWVDERGSGRLSARRCLGLAFAVQEQWAAAATVYEQAAQDGEAASDPGRAGFRAQAGNAWLAAGEPQRALQALDAALTTPGLAPPQRGQALLDRARAQVALGRAVQARADIDSALQLVPNDGFAWYLSAALARRGNDLTRAASDIARARSFSPDDPDILLLAGTIVGQAGNMNEAYTLYRRVVELAPDSDAGRQAAASLATVREIEEAAPAPQGNAPQPTPAPAPSQAPTPAPAQPPR